MKNAPADNLQITWGNTSKQFSKADLEKGINLAAEFADNQFTHPFKKLSDAVAAQQGFETPFIKSYVVSIPSFQKLFGDEEQANLEHLVEVGASKDKTLFAQSAAAVAPVHHTIKIESAK